MSTNLQRAPIAVPVELGERRYEVLIGPGLLAAAPRLLADRFPGARVAVVTDTNVATHHLRPLLEALGPTCLGTIELPPGEASKSLTHLGNVVDRLLALKLERRDLVVALGGGVIGDLAGFAAAIVRRGIPFVQIPTSLLAQVDSSVGGKTGINTPHGKNLLGAFHQPSLVLADTDVLSTLPPRQLRAGYAEVVKYGLLGDAAFFDRLETRAPHLFGNDRTELTHAIETSVRMKAAIVARDETETGDRMLLNLGHTFGHALEAWAGYSDRLLHGEAVAIGMAQAFRYSAKAGLCPAATAARVETHLRAMGLPTRIADIPGADRPEVETLLTLMRQDKKVQRGTLTFILVRDIGAAYVSREVSETDLRAFLTTELQATT